MSTEALEMMGSCVTWVTTAEILTTEIRTTGHSAANAMGRTGAFLSPYLVGTMSLQAVGSIMLLIHLFTAFCAWNLPETKGREIGHTSLDDDNGEEGKDDGNEMSFRYDSDGNMKQSSSRRIV